jgi:hypothetical protein
VTAAVATTGTAPGASAAAGSVRFWPHSAERRVASTRIRCLQVIEGLRQAGADAALYVPGEQPAVLVLAKRYDAQTLAQATSLRQRAGTRLVLDLCDNHFEDEGGSAQWLARSRQLREACAAVDLVVTATPALADVARRAVGAGPPIEVVADALDAGAAQADDRQAWDGLHALRLRAFLAMHRVAPGRRLLWFGNHGASYTGSGMEDLAGIANALDTHHRRSPIALLVVSNRWRKWRELSRDWGWPALYLPWSGANFARALESSDIALIPVQRNPFTLCKSNNRVATAFMHGLAVAAGSLPSYEEFRNLAVLDDWADGLGQLMDSTEQRAQRVAAARQRLRAAYAIEVIAARWLQLLDTLRPRAVMIPPTP